MSSALRTVIFGSVAFTFLSTLALPANAIPGVRFKRFSDYYRGEGVGTVTLIVEVTEPPTVPASISWATRDEFSATPGVDHVVASGALSWDVGDDSDREIVVTVLQDSEAESDEHFGVALDVGTAVGLEPRFPEIGFVFIVDDDGPAYFVVGEAVERNWLGRISLVGEEGGAVDLTIRLPTFPTEPVTIQYQTLPDLAIHSVVFDGVQERTVSVAAIDVPPGEASAVQQVRILGAPSRRMEEGQETSEADVRIILDVNIKNSCAMCVLIAINAALGVEFDCNDLCPLCWWVGRVPTRSGLGLPSASDWFVNMTRYRDEILSSTADGVHYTELYEALSPEMGEAFVRHPWFVYEISRALGEWGGALQAIVDGTGSSVAVTPSMQAHLDNVLDRFIETGDPELVSAVQEETTRLDLRNLTGLTMEEVQNRVETSGASAVESVSWGRIKASFR